MWLRPQLYGLHALVVAAVIVCVFMGLWQLGVYDQRQEHERADRQQVPTVPIDEVMGPEDGFAATTNHRPVEVSGEWASAEDQFWVSDRDEGGYWLAAPFLIDDAALIVVRGHTVERGDFPAVPEGRQTFEVVLEPSETLTTPLDEERVTGSVRLPMLVNEFDLGLYSGFGLNTDSAQAAGLDLVDLPGAEPSWTIGVRNLVYAIQWWVFGLFAVFMWWRMCNDLLAGRHEGEDEDAVEAAEESVT